MIVTTRERHHLLWVASGATRDERVIDCTSPVIHIVSSSLAETDHLSVWSMIRRSSIEEPRWSTRRSTWLRIGLKWSHAMMVCSWPRSAAVTAWASRHITIYLTQQLTLCVRDAVMVRTLWNTGLCSALGPSQQKETSLVKWARHWKWWRIIQERQCWLLMSRRTL